MITNGKKTKLQINMWYVSMDVMVIYVQKRAKNEENVLHSLVWFVYVSEFGINRAKPHIEYCIQRSDFTCIVLI